MTALALAPVLPDEAAISAAVEALPHVKDYLATHNDSVIRLVVADNPEEPLVVLYDANVLYPSTLRIS